MTQIKSHWKSIGDVVLDHTGVAVETIPFSGCDHCYYGNVACHTFIAGKHVSGVPHVNCAGDPNVMFRLYPQEPKSISI